MQAGRIQHRCSRLFSRWTVVWLGVLLSLADSRAVDRFDVFLGFNDLVPESSWFPIVCEVENRGPSFAGFVEVSAGGFSEGPKRRVPLELPSGTTKRLTVPVFFESTYSSGWEVRLVNHQGREVEQRKMPVRQHIKTGSVLLGSISRDDAWRPTFQKLKLTRNELQPGSARLLPGLFPDNPILLGGMDALYLNSERVLDLREGQRQAIERWVRLGGHLIVGVEGISDVNSSRWLQSLVPGRLTGMIAVEAHPELQEWLRSPVTYGHDRTDPPRTREVDLGSPSVDRPFADREDHLEFEVATLQVASIEPREARVLVAVEGHPLILQRDHGLGQVTLLAFSPEREPFRSWRNLPTLWSRLTEIEPEWYASSDYAAYGRWGVDGIFGAMIDSRQIRKLPVGWLLVLLLAYLAVIGPFDRWWLKKIGRPMLTWITFPTYVLLFSGLIYVIGYKLRAGDREWNELHVVDVVRSSSGPDLRGRTYGSLYSPVNASYRLTGPQEVAMIRGEAASSWAGRGGVERLDVLQRGDSFDAEAYVPVWTAQLYVNEWTAEGEAPVEVTLRPTDEAVRCRVRNTGERPLTGVRLLLGRRVYAFEDLAAGESRDHVLTPAEGVLLSEALSAISPDAFRSVVASRGRAFGGATAGRIDSPAEGCFVASFLGSVEGGGEQGGYELQPGVDLSPALRSSAFLVALAEGQAVAPGMNQFRASRGGADTYWRVAIPLIESRNEQ